jgi:hypothetical protein
VCGGRESHPAMPAVPLSADLLCSYGLVCRIFASGPATASCACLRERTSGRKAVAASGCAAPPLQIVLSLCFAISATCGSTFCGQCSFFASLLVQLAVPLPVSGASLGRFPGCDPV